MKARRIIVAGCVAMVLAVLLALPAAAKGSNWITHKAPPDVLLAPTVVQLSDQTALIAGGQRSAGANTATTSEAEIYDARTDQWTVTSRMPVARLFGTGVRLTNGGVLIFGGSVTDGPNAAVVYEPITAKWLSAGPLPTQVVTGAAAVPLGDGRVLVAGGQDAQRSPLAASETFDPVTSSWTVTGPMAIGRWRPGAVALASGKVLVVGGLGPHGPLSSAELFDPVTRHWSAAASMSDARWAPAIIQLADERVLVAGGEAAGPVASAEIYDPSTNAWTSAGSLVFGGVSQGVNVSGGRIVVTTYLEASDRTLHVSIFDPAHSAWNAGPDLLLTHYLETTVAINGAALVIGGSTVASLQIIAVPAPNPVSSAAVTVANSPTTTWALALSGILLLIVMSLVWTRTRWIPKQPGPAHGSGGRS